MSVEVCVCSEDLDTRGAKPPDALLPPEDLHGCATKWDKGITPSQERPAPAPPL